jgi:steroid delta-isomerase-like uncharacterized protein
MLDEMTLSWRVSTGRTFLSQADELINSIVAAWNAHDAESYVANYAEEPVMLHSTGYKAEGKEAIKAFVAGNFATYPNFQVDLQSATMAGDDVFVFYRLSGTHTGQGADSVPPTGKRFKGVPVLIHYQIADGKILKEKTYFDYFSWLQQLGYTLEPPTMEEQPKEAS